MGTLLVVLGAVIIAIFGQLPDEEKSIKDLLIIFKRITFIIYFCIQEIILSLMLILAFILKKNLNIKFCYNIETIIGILFGLVGSFLGSQVILLTKWTIGLISISILKENQFNIISIILSFILNNFNFNY